MVSVWPTCGRLVELNPLPRFPFVIFVYFTGPSPGSTLFVHAKPRNVKVWVPTLEIITAADDPVFAPSDPMTIPPKSISGGATVRYADFDTVVPLSEIGRIVLYFGTAFVVKMLRLVLTTPGSILPKEAF